MDVCDRDCFHCPHPDCILDAPMSAAEYAEARERDEALKPEGKRKRAAYMRAYYEAHREERAAYQRAYYEAHREERAAYMQAYFENNRQKIAAKNGRLLFDYRREHGMTQTEMGKRLGVSQPTISMWESGAAPFDLGEVMQRLKLPAWESAQAVTA